MRAGVASPADERSASSLSQPRRKMRAGVTSRDEHWKLPAEERSANESRQPAREVRAALVNREEKCKRE
ncbi:hypothetical protein J6590_072553 [Homalodisca vitripennis]|nr:hypothetical protein J6590_072553 [Homalodisca vitripennis]